MTEVESEILDPMERLLAERACERLIVEFLWRLDLGEPGTVAELFTADGTWEWPAGDRLVRGRDALWEYFASRPVDRLSRRVCSNVLVTVDLRDDGRCDVVFRDVPGRRLSRRHRPVAAAGRCGALRGRAPPGGGAVAAGLANHASGLRRGYGAARGRGADVSQRSSASAPQRRQCSKGVMSWRAPHAAQTRSSQQAASPPSGSAGAGAEGCRGSVSLIVDVPLSPESLPDHWPGIRIPRDGQRPRAR